jgi:glucokinase
VVATAVAGQEARRESSGAGRHRLGGVIDSASGVVTHATDALPGWAGTHWPGQRERGLGLAAYALNDVHAHALGEASSGARRGLRDAARGRARVAARSFTAGGHLSALTRWPVTSVTSRRSRRRDCPARVGEWHLRRWPAVRACRGARRGEGGGNG